MRRLQALFTLGFLWNAACGQNPDVARARAPRDAIPEAVAVAGGQLTEGVKTGNIRSKRDVEPFTITKYPVTVAQYRQCVDSRYCATPSLAEGGCQAPVGPTPRVDGATYGLGDDQLPLTCVSAAQASRYCSWVGGRLPTTAEWQLAARGPQVRRFAWGDDAPSCERHWRLAFSTKAGACCGKDCAAQGVGRVGLAPGGSSPSGVLDVLTTRAEILATDKDCPWPSCRGSKGSCLVTGSAPGAIDAFLPGSLESTSGVPAGFRCVWEGAGK